MLTDSQLQRLLAATTLAEFQSLATEFGMDLDQLDNVTPEEQAALAEGLPNAELLVQVVTRFHELNTPEQQIAVQERDAALSEIDARAGAELITEQQAEIERGTLTGELDQRLRWVYESIGILSEQQKAQILADARLQDGAQVETFEELVETGFFDMGPADPYGNPSRAAEIINDVVLDAEPAPAHLVRLRGERQFAVEDIYLQRAAATWNMTPTALSRVVRLADRAGMVGGPNNSQVFWQPLVMLMRMGGVYDEWLASTEGQSRFPRAHGGPPRRDSDRPDTLEPTIVVHPQGREIEVDRLSTDATPFSGTGSERQQQRRRLAEMGETIVAPDRTLSLTELTTEFAEGRELYEGDAGLAMIHVMDPQLASRVSREIRTTGSTAGLSVTDKSKVLDLVATMGAGVNPGSLRETLVGTGYLRAWGSPDDAFATFVEQTDAQMRALGEGAGGGGGGGGAGRQEPITVLPDPAALDETFRSLYQEMFLTDPTEEQLAGFRSQINAATSAAQNAEPGETVTNVSPEAKAMEAMRGDPRYAELYGNKPEGMSEADYRAQFEAAQQDMLGNERAGNVAMLAGLRTGRYQTAVGAAAATPEAWQNSRFLQRLFRAGEVVGSVT